eukprot:SAG11_NODE_4798_length_1763_cov_2.162260_2_plen_165_part_00
MSLTKPARCHECQGGTAGCQNFGNSANLSLALGTMCANGLPIKRLGGACNSCATGGAPFIPEPEPQSGESDEGRTVARAAGAAGMPACTEPDSAAEVARKLAASMAAARTFDVDAPAHAEGAFVPFHLQRKVETDQQAFHVRDQVYVGSECAFPATSAPPRADP